MARDGRRRTGTPPGGIVRTTARRAGRQAGSPRTPCGTRSMPQLRRRGPAARRAMPPRTRPYRWIVMSLHGLVVSAGCRVCVESASHARADDVALLAELSSGRWQARMWTTCQHRQSMLGAGWCAVPTMKRTGPRCPGLHRGGALGSWRQRAGDYLLAMWRIGAGGWPGPSPEHEPVAMPLATE